VLVLLALAGATIAPAWVLALGPVVWGVPHVLADVRYLVVRPGLHRRRAIAMTILLGLALSVAVGVRGAIAGAAAAVLLSRASPARKGGLLVIAAALFAGACTLGRTSDVLFSHLHNLVAVAFFCTWRSGSARRWVLPVAAFVGGAALIVGGGLDDLALTTHFGTFNLDLARESLTPGLRSSLATRFVLLFAFAQSVHYGVWLGLVPAEARARTTPPSFRQAARAARAELGAGLVALGAAAALVFAGWAFFDVARARDAYLVTASFHGWLEIGAAFLFLAEGRHPAGEV